MKELDLRFHGKLNPEINQLFNDISYKSRDQFNILIATISKPFKYNLDWWTQGPASRNTLASPFFHVYCCLILIPQLVGSGHFTFNKVLVDSFALKRIIESMLYDKGFQQCTVQVSSSWRQKINRALKGNLSFALLISKKLFQFFIARSTKRSSSDLSFVKPIVLIDTFMSPGCVANDRWYGELWKHLTEDMRKETFFVPTVIMTPSRAFYSLYKELRSSSRNFIIKEDYLKLKDLIFAFRYKKRIKQIKIEPVSVFGYDLSALIRNELLNNSDVQTVLESLLTYRFVSNLSQQSIKVRLAIDWFEGQAIDKAWNMAFHKYYTVVPTIGYRAYWSLPFYLCSYPIPIEKEAGVIPDKITVQGIGMKEEIKEFMPDLEVLVIPSLRTDYVTRFKANTDLSKTGYGKFVVLVTLPISIHATLRILKSLLEVQKDISHGNRDIIYIIKCHPACPINKEFRVLQNNFPPEFILSEEKSFPVLLEKSDLLITEGSSTCIEALAFGVPVIIMQNDRGLYINPIPGNIPQELYKNATTSSQLIMAINYYISLSAEEIKVQKMHGQKIKDDYFEPITKEGIERIMNINKI